MNYFYLVKNLNPWMINELHAFSNKVSFTLILLRKPAETYHKDLSILKEKSINIFIRPFTRLPHLPKVIFAFLFAIRYTQNFWGLKNFVFGIKALFWFMFIRDGIIPENASIHAQFATQASIIALMYKKYLNNVNYSFTFHAYDIYFENRWLSLLMFHSTASFAISYYTKNYLIKNYRNIENINQKIIVSKLGIELHENINNKTKYQDELTLGFLGRFVKEKNLLLLFKAIIVLLEKGDNIKLMMGGDGRFENKLKSFVHKYHLEKNIIFLHWLNNHEKVMFFKKIHVFVLSSVSEGLPVVLMEAVSHGVPVISTNISGIPEICKDGYNGFLIPSGNIDALVDAIGKFYYMDSSMYQEFRKNAYKSSREYDIQRNSINKLELMQWINAG